MPDFFKDSPFYQWVSEEALERGRAEERLKMQEERSKMQEERLKMLETSRQGVITLMGERFPQLKKLARRQVQAVKDLERLQQAILQIGLSKDIAEAAGVLAELPADSAE